jgi:hypothetical protein
MMTYIQQRTTSSVANAHGQPDKMKIAFILHSKTEETSPCSELTPSSRLVTIPAPNFQTSTQSKSREPTIVLSGAENNVLTAPLTTFLEYSTPSASNDKSNQLHQYLHTISPPNYAGAKSAPPKVRPYRPTYDCEQKFFIMYMRLSKGLSWPKIKDEFNDFFKETRSQGGLTCGYYRIRTEYGMKEVNCDGQNDQEDDLRTLENKANSQTKEFLENIGYKASAVRQRC